MLETTLRGEVGAPSKGRVRVRALHLTSEATAKAELLVSELITNAVRHTEGDIRLELELRRGELLIRVHDAGGFTLPGSWQPAAPDARTGFGLTVVDALAYEWGITNGIAWARLAL